MLLKDFNARFTLSQIRDSVWVKRRHPAICPDHFEDVARIKREMNPCSTTCYNALCHLHNQQGLEKEEENFPTLDILGKKFLYYTNDIILKANISYKILSYVRQHI